MTAWIAVFAVLDHRMPPAFYDICVSVAVNGVNCYAFSLWDYVADGKIVLTGRTVLVYYGS